MTFKTKAKKAIRKLDQFSPYPLLYPFIMSKAEIAIFDDAIKESRHYIEFGLGGSSLRAIQKSKANIFTVESNREWINYMQQYLVIRRHQHKRLHIFHSDLGPTRDWGYPVTDKNQHLFEAYSSNIFKQIDSKAIDTALVDGRFRVACTLKIIMECHMNQDVKILIHDFWNREQYHVVLKYLDTVNRADTIGLFSVKDHIDIESVKIDYNAYKHNPD